MATRTVVLATLAVITAATPALAQNWTSYQVGPLTHHNGTDNRGGSWTGNSYQVGPLTHHNLNGPHGQSQHCTSQTIGHLVYTNCY